jgi:hypothetical protein
VTDKGLTVSFDNFYDLDDDIEDFDVRDPETGKKFSSRNELFLHDLIQLSKGKNDALLDTILGEIKTKNIDWEFDLTSGTFNGNNSVTFNIDYKKSLEKMLEQDPAKILKKNWPEDILPKDIEQRKQYINSRTGIKKYNL